MDVRGATAIGGGAHGVQSDNRDGARQESSARGDDGARRRRAAVRSGRCSWRIAPARPRWPKPKKAALAKAKKKALAKAKKRAKVKAKHKKPKPKVRGHVSKKVLTVIGTARGETIVLRLKAGKPHRLQVDVGNNGSAEWEVNRNRFDRIFVFALGGDDRVLIDEANGVFTDTEATTLSGDSGNDDLRGGAARAVLRRAPTTTPSTETEATISRIWGGRRLVHLGSR